MTNEEITRPCHSCRWYAEFEGVCCCGESEWCADWPPEPDEGCSEWEVKA